MKFVQTVRVLDYVWHEFILPRGIGIFIFGTNSCVSVRRVNGETLVIHTVSTLLHASYVMRDKAPQIKTEEILFRRGNL